MTQRHVYLAVENLNLNPTQRTTLVDALKALGPASNKQPSRLNHWRTRLDNEAVILEALFNEDNLTVDVFKDRLGAIFSVNPATIDHSTLTPTFDSRPSPVVTFSRSGIDYIKFCLFGGVGATWQQSGNECRAYLAANRAEWEPEEL